MWSLALRNLRRDRRRTWTTMAAIGTGVLAVLAFMAYTRFVESALSKVVIYQEGNGHVQVYRHGGPQNLAVHPARYSLSREDQDLVATATKTLRGVRRVGAQMTGVGLVQHGAKSAVFLAWGVDPEVDAALQAASGLNPGGAARVALRAGALVTPQLADILGLSPGGDIQLAVASYANRLNAADATVEGYFSTGIEAIEDKGLKMPLAMMQSLYDTDAVSRMVLELEDQATTDTAAAALAASLEKTRPGHFAVTTWHSPAVGQLYNSFMGFFRMLFAFTGLVVLSVIIATAQHAVSMNIADRMREIGTLRALGFSRGEVVGLFVREAVLVALAAAAAATALAYGLFTALGAAGLATLLPRVAHPVPLLLDLPIGAAGAVCFATIGFIAVTTGVTAWHRVGGTVRGKRGARLPLARLLAGVAAALLVVLLPLAQSLAATMPPDERIMREWLRRADIARGGFGSYAWTLRIHSEEPAGNTDTTYAVAVRDGKALALTTEPKRYQGEKILINGRAMWYVKPGLRRPISVSPQQRLVGEAANGDIASVRYSRDYRPQFAGEERLDGRDCYKLELIAVDDKVTYESILYYLDKQSLLGMRADFMTASGTVFKIARFEYRNTIEFEGRETPFVSRMRIINASFPDRFSELAYDGVAVARNPESLFMLGNLMAQ